MMKRIPEVVSGRGCQRTNKHEAVNPEEAAATAWTYMELLLLHSLKMSLQSASTGRENCWKTRASLLRNHMAPSFSGRSQSCRVCFISGRTSGTEERFPGSYINPSSKNMTENKNIGQFNIQIPEWCSRTLESSDMSTVAQSLSSSVMNVCSNLFFIWVYV